MPFSVEHRVSIRLMVYPMRGVSDLVGPLRLETFFILESTGSENKSLTIFDFLPQTIYGNVLFPRFREQVVFAGICTPTHTDCSQVKYSWSPRESTRTHDRLS